jgi:hypothetical protein
MFSEDKTEARKLYRDYMAEGPTVKKEEIYSTIEQQIPGDEKFLEKVTERSDIEIRQKKRKRQYTLPEITRGVEKVYGITFKQILEKGKTGNISLGRKLLSLVANEYEYTGREIAEYIRKDPAIVTTSLKERIILEGEIEKVIKMLRNEPLAKVLICHPEPVEGCSNCLICRNSSTSSE